MHDAEYYQAMVLSHNLRTFLPATFIPSSLFFGASGAFSATYGTAGGGGGFSGSSGSAACSSSSSSSRKRTQSPSYAAQLSKKLRSSSYT